MERRPANFAYSAPGDFFCWASPLVPFTWCVDVSPSGMRGIGRVVSSGGRPRCSASLGGDASSRSVGLGLRRALVVCERRQRALDRRIRRGHHLDRAVSKAGGRRARARTPAAPTAG
ncbi:hypothetical protein AKJ09_06715 [Labilithrix luteola]|uniref:Uncharacterized protein n=1 Tax=Labilithrix luteola TaxID=1391654 RepID=A0A0K1Q315_9BACT|nr:hypothetical protein AKJ09_06715 [Labilithrix luteola]